MAVRRMVQAGVVQITWMAVAGELQRDWAREETGRAVGEMFSAHGGGTGVAFAWEMQLLGQKAGGAGVGEMALSNFNCRAPCVQACRPARTVFQRGVRRPAARCARG